MTMTDTLSYNYNYAYAIPHSTISQNILLDSSIRDWVVLPLLIIMVQAGLLRHYLSLFLKSGSTSKLNKIEQRTKATLNRAARLRSGAGSYLSQSKWESRIQYWTADDGYLKEEILWIPEEQDRQDEERKEKEASGEAVEEDDAMDPMAMLGPMKGQFAFMAQNMILMQGIGYFFSGYVLVKVPIPLTNGFKMMFQRGLDLSTLETSYVSSVSWYFLVMFGLRAFFKLVIESNDGGSDSGLQDEHKRAGIVQTELGNGFSAGGPAKKFDAAGFLKGEIEALELMKYNRILDDADRRLLGKTAFSKKIAGLKGSGSEPGYDIFGAAASAKGSSISSTTSTTKTKSSTKAKKAN